MIPDRTVTYWIQQLKAENSLAAREIWNRYFKRLVSLAQSELAGIPQWVMDAEDIALSVMKSLCLGAARGAFPELHDREDLWRVLVTITHQKAVNQIRHHLALKRGGGKVRGDSALNQERKENASGFDDCPSDMPDPAFLAMLEDQLQHLLALLRSDELRQIAQSRLEGKTINEIAGEMNVSRRTVSRKLKLIREDWEGELPF